MKKFAFIVMGIVVYLLFYFVTFGLIIFISDLLRINPSNVVLLSFVLPFFPVYYLLYKFFPKEQALKLSFISIALAIIIFIGSCSILMAYFSNAPNYW